MPQARDENGRFIKADSTAKTSTPKKTKEQKPAKVDTRPIEAGAVSPKYRDRRVLTGKTFIFTAAQNNTAVHESFLYNLKAYAAFLDGKLVIGTFVYNKNGFQNGTMESDDIWFNPLVKPYLVAEQATVSDKLVWCGELNILPTAKYPLSGFEQYTGTLSSILPASKIALESVATSKGQTTKMLYGTGCVTLRNYIPKKAGQVADSAHSYGALIVEVLEDGQFFARQIETDETGNFQDLTNVVRNGMVTFDPNTIQAINLGDLHAEKSDYEVLACVENMLHALRPEHLILHDCFDMTTRNHHNRKNPHFIAKMHQQRQSVKGDLQETARVLERLHEATESCSQLVVVESNHDLALEKWLQATDYDFRQDDPDNAMTYLELQTACYRDILAGDTSHVLPMALKLYNTSEYEGWLDNIRFLETDESFVLAGVEFGFHGHTGINGAKGQPKQFQKLSIPLNTGHTHSASIFGQVYTAGVTGSLDMEYNKGPSSWSHSHIVTYSNGMRCIITLVKDSEGCWQWQA